MSDILGTAKAIFTFVGPFIGGGSVASIWTYLSTRHRTRHSSPAAMAESQAAVAEALAGQTKAILDEHARDRDDLRRIVVKQGRRLTRLVRDVAECNKHHEACEANLAYVRAQIAQMMSDPSAPALVINPHPLKEQLDAAD